VHAFPNKFFSCFIFWFFSNLYFAECFSLPSAKHSAKPLPSARQKVLGKDVFADALFAERPLPSVILGSLCRV
jgi:hypothetical protein